MSADILVTGAASGLGKFLHEKLGGEGLTRANSRDVFKKLSGTGVGTIIHCAATSKRGQTSEPLYGYVEDNLLLTQRLASLPHKKFVYVSSISVYPDTPGPHREDDYVPADATGGGVYGVTKLMAESIVNEIAEEPLILRPVFMLGADARPGNLVKVLSAGTPELELSGESTFNVVTHETMLAFLEIALKENLQGIYNAASNDAIALSEAAELAGASPKFGKGRYKTPAIDNAKIKAVCPAFNKSSADAIREFLKK